MRTQYPLSEAKHARILKKSGLAIERRRKARKRIDIEHTSHWVALWMTALGLIKFPKEPEGEHLP